MNLEPSYFNAALMDDEWQVIAPECWQTPIGAACWSYTSQKDGLPSYAKPPHYHEVLFHSQPSVGLSTYQKTLPDLYGNHGRLFDNISNNSALIDMQPGGETVVVHSGVPDGSVAGIGTGTSSTTHVDLNRNSEDLSFNQGWWNDLVDDLIGGSFDDLSDSSCGFYGSSLTNSFFSSVDSTDSDQSLDQFAMPSTPKAKISYASAVKNVFDISVSNSNPTIRPKSSKPLNIAAKSFVPSFPQITASEHYDFPSLDPETTTVAPPPISQHASISFANFTFPTLADAKNDEKGISKVKPAGAGRFNGRGSSDLPPFLQDSSYRRKPRLSKTREIVDRLRSQSLADAASAPPFFEPNSMMTKPTITHSMSLNDLTFLQPQQSRSDAGDQDSGMSTPSIEDDDGWINVAESKTASPSAKTRRTRDLFLALTRRRTDSLKSSLGSDSGTANSHPLDMYLSPSRCSTPFSSYGDGWIESTDSISVYEAQNQSPGPIETSTDPEVFMVYTPPSSTPVTPQSTSFQIPAAPYSKSHSRPQPSQVGSMPLFCGLYSTPVSLAGYLQAQLQLGAVQPTFPFGQGQGLEVMQPALVPSRSSSKRYTTPKANTNMNPAPFGVHIPLW